MPEKRSSTRATRRTTPVKLKSSSSTAISKSQAMLLSKAKSKSKSKSRSKPSSMEASCKIDELGPGMGPHIVTPLIPHDVYLFETYLPVFIRGMGHLSNILSIAQVHVKATKGCEKSLLAAKLSNDMTGGVPFHVQRVTDIANFAVERLASVSHISCPDNEKTISELQVRVSKVIEHLKKVCPSKMEGKADLEFTVKRDKSGHKFNGKSYVFVFALPNFFFHMSIAYAILRAEGVPVGKGDFLGHDVYP